MAALDDAPNKKDFAERQLQRLVRIFDIQVVTPEKTAILSKISHEGACLALDYWLEQMRIVLEEPVNIAVTQSLRDEGVDLLIEFLKSKIKFGFQIKSYDDIKDFEFHQKTMSQIYRSQKHDLDHLFLVLCADLNEQKQRDKVRSLVSDISQIGDYCKVILPEKVTRVVDVYEKKEHPITYVEGMARVLDLISGLLKKLEDNVYTPTISITYKLKERLDPDQYPLKGSITLKYPKGTKQKMLPELLKQAELTGEPVTIPGEYIEDFQWADRGRSLFPEGFKPKYLTITPEKPKFPMTIETTDPRDGSLISFKDVIFVRDAIKGTTVHLSTHDNNLPYSFRMSFDKEGVGNFGISIDEKTADVAQYLKFEKFLLALAKGQELVFKRSPEGKIMMRSPLKNVNLKTLDERWFNLLEDLAYVQAKTGHRIPIPESVTPKDLYDVSRMLELLKNGKTEMSQVRITIKLTKENALAFLKEFKEKKTLKDFIVGIDPLKAPIFGETIFLGRGRFALPETRTVEDVETLRTRINGIEDDSSLEIEIENVLPFPAILYLDRLQNSTK